MQTLANAGSDLADAGSAAGTVWPVILCGGSGRRLWPVSRRDHPKQFQRLSSDKSLVQETALRARDGLGLGMPVLLCNETHRFMLQDHMAEIGIEAAALLSEPQSRNTAPAIAAAARFVSDRDPDAMLLVMPSDHFIGNQAAFATAFAKARQIAQTGRLVTFGIRPVRPETGYGYIEQGRPVEPAGTGFEIASFMEKPALARAEELVRGGRHLWNSGIFLLPVRVLIDEFERLCPDILAAASAALSAARDSDGRLLLDTTAFLTAPAASIDVAVMEHTRLGAVVPADMDWSDIGTWPALREMRGGDAMGNVLDGNAVVEDVTNCFIQSTGRLIAAIGLDDVVIVETDDAVLISGAGHAARLDGLVGRLRDAGQSAADRHLRVHRPWGHYRTVDRGDRYQVKHIQVKPGESTSLQFHHHRAEHWIVVSGTGRVVRDGETILLHECQSLHIPPGVSHRLENPGKIPLRIAEVQVGAYLGEDDIVRLDDRYGRA
ncbi:MAG: mannose-1-phosphate guanylyltransferase/mannose-6-phosphate isomerase [Sneathiellaceae bacterium]